ncbi:hypothetical protein D3C80_1629810 [compost metagenome]
MLQGLELGQGLPVLHTGLEVIGGHGHDLLHGAQARGAGSQHCVVEGFLQDFLGCLAANEQGAFRNYYMVQGDVSRAGSVDQLVAVQHRPHRVTLDQE